MINYIGYLLLIVMIVDLCGMYLLTPLPSCAFTWILREDTWMCRRPFWQYQLHYSWVLRTLPAWMLPTKILFNVCFPIGKIPLNSLGYYVWTYKTTLLPVDITRSSQSCWKCVTVDLHWPDLVSSACVCGFSVFEALQCYVANSSGRMYRKIELTQWVAL